MWLVYVGMESLLAVSFVKAMLAVYHASLMGLQLYQPKDLNGLFCQA